MVSRPNRFASAPAASGQSPHRPLRRNQHHPFWRRRGGAREQCQWPIVPAMADASRSGRNAGGGGEEASRTSRRRARDPATSQRTAICDASRPSIADRADPRHQRPARNHQRRGLVGCRTANRRTAVKRLARSEWVPWSWATSAIGSPAQPSTSLDSRQHKSTSLECMVSSAKASPDGWSGKR